MNELALLKRRSRIAELYLEGHTRDSIAEKLECSQGSVSNDLAVIREMWAESVRGDIEQLKAEELARLAQIQQAAWTVFRATFHPALLREMTRCVELRMKLLGLLRETVATAKENFWDALASGVSDADPIEDRITQLERSNSK